jgi:small GTP-binding protein
MSKCKALIVGDGAIGKTCLLSRLTNNVVDWSDGSPPYEPTTFTNFQLTWESEPDETNPTPQILDLELWDTAGQEGFEQLRTLSYPGTDIYLIGYSTDSLISLNNIEHKWLQEIKQGLLDQNENAPPWTIMVGTKMDLRAADVTVEKASEVAKSIDACCLVDTSAKMDDTTKSGTDLLQSQIMRLGFMKAEGDARPKWGDIPYENTMDGTLAAVAISNKGGPAEAHIAAKAGDTELRGGGGAPAPPNKPPAPAPPNKPPAAPTTAKDSPKDSTSTQNPPDEPSTKGTPPDEGCKCVIA